MKCKLSAFICIIIVCLSLFGCSTNENKDIINNFDASLTKHDNTKISILFLYYNLDHNEYKVKSNDDEMIEKIEKSLLQKGFNVDLIPYYLISTNNVPRKSYIETIKENLASGRIDAFHLPSYYEKFEGSASVDSVLKDVMDIKEIMMEQAPILYKKLIDDGAIRDIDEEVSFITMFDRNVYAENDRIRIVLPEDSAKKYGSENMNTFNDYIKFLRKVKSESSNTPGFITPFYNLMIALQESRYYCIDNMLARTTTDKPMFAFSYSDKAMNDPIPFESIPGMKDQLMLINSLYQEGLLAYGKNPGDTEAFFKNKKNTQSAQMLEMKNSSAGGSIFNSLASFIGGWEDSEYLPLLQGSKVFILNPQIATIKNDMTTYDRIYLSKHTKNAETLMRFMESVCIDRSIYDAVRYGIIDEDYSLQNRRVNFLLDKKPVADVNSYKKVHFYRNISNFNFLLNSEFERYDSKIPSNYEQETNKLQKVQNELLPFEKLVAENRYINLQDTSAGIRQRLTGEKAKTDGSKYNVDELSILRSGKIFQLLDRIWSPDFEKLYDEFVKSQDPDDIKAIKEYYKELIKELD